MKHTDLVYLCLCHLHPPSFTKLSCDIKTHHPKCHIIYLSLTIHHPTKNFYLKNFIYDLAKLLYIFHQPRFLWNKGSSLPQLTFGVRSFEVAIIWSDVMILSPSFSSPNQRHLLPLLPTLPRTNLQYCFQPDPQKLVDRNESLPSLPTRQTYFHASFSNVLMFGNGGRCRCSCGVPKKCVKKDVEQ